MNLDDRRMVDETIEKLLSLPEDRRAVAFAELRYNGIFCTECGYGRRDRPNPNCQCTNDE